MRKGQVRRPLLDARGLWALRRHCITHRHDSVIDITKWAQEYFQKPLSVNTIRHAIGRCQLKLYQAKRKPYVNMVQKRRCVLWAKAHLKWTVSKKKGKVQSPNLTFMLEIMDAVSSGLKRRETFQLVISIQFKSQHIWWHGGAWVHTVWATSMFWKALLMLKCVYKGFRATYAPLQTTCVTAGQCKPTYCSYYNSMALMCCISLLAVQIFQLKRTFGASLY